VAVFMRITHPRWERQFLIAAASTTVNVVARYRIALLNPGLFSLEH